MSKKSILYNNLLYEIGQDFLDRQYTLDIHLPPTMTSFIPLFYICTHIRIGSILFSSIAKPPFGIFSPDSINP